MVATIKDIAREANVSTATVSRVINNLGGYGVETEKKVLKAAEKLGYSKNENAISLVTNRSRTIGIVIPNVNTGFYGDIVNGIEDRAYEAGYSVILTHAGIEGVRLTNSLKVMGNRRVDGIIIVSINLDASQISLIKKMSLPTILLSTQSDESLPYIKVNDYAAIYAATEYLLLKNHKHIGLAGLNREDPVAGSPRIKGYSDCLERYGIAIDQDLIVNGDFSFDAGKEAMKFYLKQKYLPSAIICASDETALGIISVASESGINIPNDLSVIGYDDTNISWMTTPSLTTIKQPFYEMGSKGCAALINSILEGKPIVSQILPFSLIERNTVIQKTN